MIPEEPVRIPAGTGPALEGALSLPTGVRTGVVICHPHPRYGGDMDSPVVVTAAGACARRGLATLRFNFRGVGGSGGAWDEGRREQDDVRAAMAYLGGRLGPPARVALAGYSFGASMAAAIATASPPAGLALIAPPLATPGWKPPSPLAMAGPRLIVAGSGDAYCPTNALAALGRELPGTRIVVIDGADHFFFTTLDDLEAAVGDWADRLRGAAAA